MGGQLFYSLDGKEKGKRQSAFELVLYHKAMAMRRAEAKAGEEEEEKKIYPSKSNGGNYVSDSMKKAKKKR